tara:strand:+ start:227329 stop:228684 length:1356 start_codon:yes stop_codon:yes gene_type:complete
MRSLLEISKSGLKSAERSLAVTSNNIINADTAGYTRQRVDKTPVGMQMSGYSTGLGVNITTVTRMRNAMNDELLNEKRQDMSYMQSKAAVYEQMEASMVSDSGFDIDMSISNLLDAFSDLGTDPQDISVRNTVLSEAQQLTAKFADISSNLKRTSELTREYATQNLGEVNDLLQEIHTLNQAVAQAQGAGDPDNASLDQRVRKLQELSELINFDSQDAGNGALELSVNGIKVLDVDKAFTLKTEIDESTKGFNIRLESGKLIDITGGELGAQIEMYQQGIPDILGRLDDLAGTIVSEINAVHAAGFGLDDSATRPFFDPAYSDADTIRVNSVLLENPRHIASSDTAGEAGNGEIAARIAELRNDELIDGRKLVDYAVDIISTPGTLLSGLNNRIEARDSEIQMLQNQQEREAGVNIDEELSLMIQYQNAYQGAAKIMQAAQDMYDTLITIV